MNRYRNLFAPKTKRFLLFFFAISPWISACSENSPLPEPPISVPFSLEDIGSRIEKDFRVVDHNVYYFRLSFAYEDGNQIDRARVKKLMGEHELDKFGNVVRPGVKTPIRLAIFSMGASAYKLVYETESNPFLTSWDGNSFGKNIGHTVLPPGHYRIRLENLRNAPEFLGTPVTFVIWRNPKSNFKPK